MTDTIDELIDQTANVELATGDEISHADITARIPEVWAPIIEAAADRLRVMRNLCKINTDLVGRPGDTVKIPKKGILDIDTYTMADASELVELEPNAELTYDTVTLTPTERAISGAITKQAIDEAMVSIIDDLLSEFGRAVADREDLDIIKAATATTTSEEIKYVEANADSDVYVTGSWTVSVAGTISSATVGSRKRLKWSGNQTNLAVGDVLDLGVIIEASDVIMFDDGFVADTLVAHSKQLADLKRSPQFLDASKAGDNMTLRTGQIGRVFDLNIYKSSNLPILKCGADGSIKGYQALLIDSTRALGFAIKRQVTVETEYKPSKRKHFVYVTSMYDVKRLNNQAIIAINTC